MRAVFCFVVLFWAFSIDVAVGTPPISAFRHHKTGYSSDRKHLAPSGRCNTLLKMEAAEDSCSSPRKPTAPKIIIAGAPAAGKGTQCELIKRELGVVHLSTGDMLRAAVKDQTELGMKVKTYMEEGKLVPDDLIINVVVERLQMPDCQSKGWLLDGFPRTRAQADALTRLGIEVDQFVLLDVPQEVVVERVTGRRTDPDTGRIYHMTFSPPDPVADAEVIARLVQRSDDTEDKVRRRFADYCKHVDSVKACYGDRTLWVDGSISPSEVSEVILSALGEVVTAADKVVEGASLGTAAAAAAAAGGSGVGEGLRGSTPGGGGGGDVGAFSVGSSTALRLLRAAHSEDNVRKRARKASTASTAHADNAGAKEIGSHAFGLRNFGPRASAQTARFAK